jgi:hypothetical protein
MQSGGWALCRGWLSPMAERGEHPHSAEYEHHDATAMMTRTSSITILNTWLSVHQRSPRRASFLYEAVRHRPFTGFIVGVRLPRAEKQSHSRGSWDRSWYSMASRTRCSSSCEPISVSLPPPGLLPNRPQRRRSDSAASRCESLPPAPPDDRRMVYTELAAKTTGRHRCD